MKDYYSTIFRSDDDRAYEAGIPDHNACSAFGGMPGEAPAELEIAKAMWPVAREGGKPLPAPTYKAAIYQAAYAS